MDIMLRDKNGNVYRLKEPNPVVKGQTKWSESELVFHNLQWEDIVVFDDDENLPPPVIVQEAPKVIEPKPPEPPEEEPPTPVPTPSQLGHLKNVVVFHCLPAVKKVHKDELYGESYSKIEYQKKFVFEGIIVETGDLGIKFWTNIDIPEFSVVFPARYRSGVKFGEYRWWKVSGKEKKSNGFLTTAVASDYQPDFSD